MTTPPHAPVSRVLAVPASAALLAISAACGSTRTGASELSASAPQHGGTQEVGMNGCAAPSDAPAEGASVRVGGDLEAKVSGRNGDFRCGPCRVDTLLPDGYPAPTPAGAIDLKTYPSVRLAEVQGSGGPDSGMNRAFWPLFNHIKEHDIPMTSPVEMNYSGLGGNAGARPTSWSMAFLYRSPGLNAIGTEGSVVVRDAEPVTVLAVGVKGHYSMSLVRRGMKQIEGWLAANPSWKPAGEWRCLYYNGPTLMFWNKWAEVQIPVRRSVPQLSSSADASGAGSGR